jgi:sulfate transport system substrate-binding protein
MLVRHGYRPSNPVVAKKTEGQFGKLRLVKVEDYFGGWDKAQKTHFSEGGTFDQIYAARL